MPLWALIVEFIVCACIIWVAGSWLTKSTYIIDSRFKLGSAFGGVLILGIGTSLPEIAVVISAALAHRYDVIIGTLLGGVALQTATISLFDARMKVKRPITRMAASSVLVLEALISIVIIAAAMVAVRKPFLVYSWLSVSSLLILLFWLFGLWLIYQVKGRIPKPSSVVASRTGSKITTPASSRQLAAAPNVKLFAILLVSALAILVAGVGLQSSGTHIADAWGIGAGFFAATFIALCSSLPDISTGISSVDLGDYRLAISDIFGANAFMPALFLICDIIAGHAVLVRATSTDMWFAAMGILLTAIYAIGLVVRPKKLYFRMGTDSIVVLVLYLAGTIALSQWH